jgi:predicted HTH transcriptional regulator
VTWIEKLISKGEHQQQDFKMRIDSSRKIARTLVAFANSDGGRLLIGVKDNGKVSGISAEEELHMIEAAAEMYCDPAVQFKAQVWKVDFKTVLEIVVEPSSIKPHQCEEEPGKWRTYIRREDENIKANRVMMKVWKHEQNRRTDQFEYTSQKEKLFDHFKENEVLGFKKISRITGLSSWKTEDLLAQLIAWNIVEMELTEKGYFYRLRSPMEQEKPR